MDNDRLSSLSELVDYLVAEPEKDSIIHVRTQNFGEIDMLLLATTEFEGSPYYLFCEVDKEKPVTDASGIMHLIILRGDGDRGLYAISDDRELERIADEFYCILLAETDVQLDNGEIEPPALEIESATDDSGIDGDISSLDIDLSLVQGEGSYEETYTPDDNDPL